MSQDDTIVAFHQIRLADVSESAAALPVERPVDDHTGHRRLVTALVALLAIAGAVALVVRHERRATHATLPYETVTVDRGRIVARVTATGTLSALVTVQVGTQVSGRIQSLDVDFNSPVRKGQRIAKIDPRLYAATVEQAQANLLAAMGQLEGARVNWANDELLRTRDKALRADRLIAQSDLDTANATADAARAQVSALDGQVKQARAALHQARINLDYTDIVSPTDGTVISRNVDVGQTVAAALQAPTLFVIAEDLRKMQVDTSVAEADVGKLESGMEATFTVDAYPNDRFRSVVRQVRNNPQTVQNVVTYDAVLDVQNSDLRLKPGMTATVTFIYGQQADVLRVPNAALRFRAPDAWTSGRARPAESPDHRTVWVLRNQVPTPVTIQIGMSDGTVTEVRGGSLEVADVLITDAGGTSAVPVGGLRRMF